MQAIIKSHDLASCAEITEANAGMKQLSGCHTQKHPERQDTILTGCKVYTDAAWKLDVAATSTGAAKAKIGIFIQLEEDEQEQINISISAVGV